MGVSSVTDGCVPELFEQTKLEERTIKPSQTPPAWPNNDELVAADCVVGEKKSTPLAQNQTRHDQLRVASNAQLRKIQSELFSSADAIVDSIARLATPGASLQQLAAMLRGHQLRREAGAHDDVRLLSERISNLVTTLKPRELSVIGDALRKDAGSEPVAVDLKNAGELAGDVDVAAALSRAIRQSEPNFGGFVKVANGQLAAADATLETVLIALQRIDWLERFSPEALRERATFAATSPWQALPFHFEAVTGTVVSSSGKVTLFTDKGETVEAPPPAQEPWQGSEIVGGWRVKRSFGGIAIQAHAHSIRNANGGYPTWSIPQTLEVLISYSLDYETFSRHLAGGSFRATFDELQQQFANGPPAMQNTLEQIDQLLQALEKPMEQSPTPSVDIETTREMLKHEVGFFSNFFYHRGE